MGKSLVFCPSCAFGVYMENGLINRAKKIGAPLYCGRECAGIARRKEPLSDAERCRDKAAYDREYRAKNRASIKARKAAYFQATYDPEKARVERAAKMDRHVEYCRRPEYRAYKVQYDRTYRAKKDFGPFWESSVLLTNIQTEVLSRASRYEIDLQNDKLNKATRRRRDYEKTLGSSAKGYALGNPEQH